MGSPVRTRTDPDTVALTFDDGPSPWTAAALAELARCDATATFFINPLAGPGDLVRRIAEAGHEVGYHCRDHVRHSDRDRAEVRNEALADLEWMGGLGLRPRAWRTPWGDLAGWSAELAAELELELWGWSDDTEDWFGRDAGEMLADLEGSLSGGSVVLMHDGIGPGARRSSCSATVEMVAPLVELCRRRGLAPSSLTAVAAGCR